jgi:hypothetical protein
VKWVVASLLLVACTPEQQPTKPEGPPAVASATASATALPTKPGDTFGKSIDSDTPFVALGDILKDPKAYNGKKVRTRGEVIAVCMAAGCWADLKPEGAAADKAIAPTHVTMHNHAFFLPKHAKTKVAEIEGNLVVRELSQSEVDHYNSEGASLTAGTPLVNVDALGVVLR